MVTCPYCGNPAKLVDSATIYRGKSYGMIWDCRPCDAYVGVHKESKDHAPLGRLANKELREWKVRAHDKFDILWQSGAMTRKDAYAHLQKIMDMPSSVAHIGKFTVEECKKLVMLLNSQAAKQAFLTEPPKVKNSTEPISIVGKDYKAVEITCGCAPWEDCDKCRIPLTKLK